MKLTFLSKKLARADRRIKLAGALGLLLAVSLIVSLAAPALASVPPQWDHAFQGDVFVDTLGNPPVPEGTLVTAEIAGKQLANTTVDDLGRYGYTPCNYSFTVPTDDPDTPEEENFNGETISFYVDVDGSKILAATFTFTSGLHTDLDLPVTVVDTTPPSVTITELTPDPTNVNTPTFTGTATDEFSNISLVEYKVDDGSWATANASDGAFDELSEDYTFITATLLDGAHTVYVRATDTAPNTTAEADYASDEFTVDTVAPTATLSPVDTATDVAINAPVTATFGEGVTEVDLSGITITQGAPGVSPTLDANTITIAHGDFALDTSYTVTIPAEAVEDLAGNLNAEISWSFTTVFVPITYTLTVDSTAGGEVTLPGEDTFGPYDPEEEVPLLAEPADGYQFLSWTGDVDTVAEPTAESTTITMNGNYSIQANFGEIGVTYSLTVDSSDGGSVTDPGEGTFLDYSAGTPVALLAEADTGYLFVNWTGDTADIADANAASTTITMNGNYSITANFVEVTGDLRELIVGTPSGGTLDFDVPELGPGTYTGNVTISQPITIRGTEGVIISGGIHVAPLDGSEFTIENVTITDYTNYGIWIELVGADDLFIIYNNTILGVEGSVVGVKVDKVEAGGGLTIALNSISGNEVGIELGEDVKRANIAFNNIDGNDVGLELLAVGEHQVGASLNWWGDISGPEEVNENPGGTGDKIELIDGPGYQPWLTRDFQTVLDDNIAYFGLPAVELSTGWNIISTPIALDPRVEWVDSDNISRTGVDTWGDYIALGDGLSTDNTSPAYRFDGESQAWVPLSSDSPLKPCDAIYVRMASDDIAAILLSPNVSVPSKELYSGWNLVGLAWLPGRMGAVNGMRANVALVTVEEVAGGFKGYKLVVSPGVNATHDRSWIYIAGRPIEDWTGEGSAPAGWMKPTSGYWVFMLNDGTLAGFTFTPISLD